MSGLEILLLYGSRIFPVVATRDVEASPGYGLVLALKPEIVLVLKSKRCEPAAVGTAGVQWDDTRSPLDRLRDHQLRPVPEENS